MTTTTTRPPREPAIIAERMRDRALDVLRREHPGSIVCEACLSPFPRPTGRGRPPAVCSPACRKRRKVQRERARSAQERLDARRDLYRRAGAVFDPALPHATRMLLLEGAAGYRASAAMKTGAHAAVVDWGDLMASAERLQRDRSRYGYKRRSVADVAAEARRRVTDEAADAASLWVPPGEVQVLDENGRPDLGAAGFHVERGVVVREHWDASTGERTPLRYDETRPTYTGDWTPAQWAVNVAEEIARNFPTSDLGGRLRADLQEWHRLTFSERASRIRAKYGEELFLE